MAKGMGGGTLLTSNKSLRRPALILQGQWWNLNSLLLLTSMINECADAPWVLKIIHPLFSLVL